MDGSAESPHSQDVPDHHLDKLFDFNDETTFICSSIPCYVDYTYANKYCTP